MKARWAGKVTAHADCMVVIHTTSKAGASLRDQFKYGGCHEHEAFALKEVVKADAHEIREQAEKDGW